MKKISEHIQNIYTFRENFRSNFPEIPEADTLADLDWHTLQCRCPHHGGCTNQASLALHIHLLHNCNSPDADPFGNRIEIRCAHCAGLIQDEIAYSLRRLRRIGITSTHCIGCGAPIAETEDVIREMRTIG